MDQDVIRRPHDKYAQKTTSRTAKLWSIRKPIRKGDTDRVNANIFGLVQVHPTFQREQMNGIHETVTSRNLNQ